MAATVNTMEFMGVDGKPFTVFSYNAPNAAVGTFLPVDQTGVATENSPLSFICPKDCYLTDFIAGAATGTVQIISSGNATGSYIDYSTRQADNAGRREYRIPISKGTEVRFKVVSALPA
jgi:hypothetical protein